MRRAPVRRLLECVVRPFADELKQRLVGLSRPELSVVVPVVLRKRLLHVVRSSRVRVDPFVVDAPAEERPVGPRAHLGAERGGRPGGPGEDEESADSAQLDELVSELRAMPSAERVEAKMGEAGSDGHSGRADGQPQGHEGVGTDHQQD